MAPPFVGSSLRRLCAPTGALALLGLVLAAGAFAATPSPDPPPQAVAPESPPVTHAVKPAPAAKPSVVTPARVARVAPVARVQPTRGPVVTPTSTPAARPKLRPKPAAKPKPVPAAAERRTVRPAPHDRAPVPLAAFVAAEESLDRALLAFGGAALLLVALGGAVMLGIARRQLLAAGFLLVLLAPAQALAAPVSYTLTGSAGNNGWYRSNVTIRWVVDPTDLVSAQCPAAELISTEGATNRQCTATFTWGTVTSPVVTIKIDRTAPTGIAAALSRAPDSEGWFNHAVTATFTAQDTVSGVAGCTSPSYEGADSATAGLTGTCTDAAGNAVSASVALKYDATPPSVTPSPDRPPDHRGWYRKPVTVSFAGTDATSGIASCTAPTRYAGPDGEKASVVGSCRDRAGNAAEAGAGFPYDATAPKLARVKADVAKGIARIGWDRAADVAKVELLRSPGVNGARSTIVYQGSGAAFVDRTVKPGIRYRYELSVSDAAGNVARKAVTTLERSSALLGPAPGAVVRSPPVLRWQPVKGATFYNVQLYRNGVKVLSTWPPKAVLKLGRSWTYAGKRQRLLPGTYRWYVWGAKGTRARPTYGRALGTSTFVVKR